MSILVGSYDHEFSASSGRKCKMSIWNQLYLKERGFYYVFRQKVTFHILTFFLFLPISPFLDFFIWSRTYILSEPYAREKFSVEQFLFHAFFDAGITAKNRIVREFQPL